MEIRPYFARVICAIVLNLELHMLSFSLPGGDIPSAADSVDLRLQPQAGAARRSKGSRVESHESPREIPPPAGKGAGVRDDASARKTSDCRRIQIKKIQIKSLNLWIQRTCWRVDLGRSG